MESGSVEVPARNGIESRRRSPGAMADNSQSTLRFPPFHIPAGVDVVFRGDEVVPLEPLAVRVLRYLVERRDRVVAKEELLDAVWPDIFTTDAVLKTAVLKIRRAL